MVAGGIQQKGGVVRRAELACWVWLPGASVLCSWNGPMSCTHRRGVSLPWAHCHSCVGTGTQPWVLPYKMGYFYEPSALGTRVWWSLSPAPLRLGGIMWPLVLAAADVPGGCFFFLAVFECFVGAVDNGRGVLIVHICPFAGFLCLWLFCICHFLGVNAPVELLGDAWWSPWAVGITRLFLFSAAWLCHCWDFPWLLLTELLPLLDHEWKGRVFDFGFKRCNNRGP